MAVAQVSPSSKPSIHASASRFPLSPSTPSGPEAKEESYFSINLFINFFYIKNKKLIQRNKVKENM